MEITVGEEVVIEVVTDITTTIVIGITITTTNHGIILITTIIMIRK